MDQFRLVYRHPDVETLLLLVVLFQIVTGIRLIYKRDAQTIAEKIQVYSGLYLSFSSLPTLAQFFPGGTSST